MVGEGEEHQGEAHTQIGGQEKWTSVGKRIRIKLRIRIKIRIRIKLRIRIKTRIRTRNLPTASVRKRETTPPRSSVRPHTIAPVFSSSNSGDGDFGVNIGDWCKDWLTAVDNRAVEASSPGEAERISTR